jgi:hypothetical protein
MLITPSGSENIPSVNACKNVFFIQHIYKSATSSHSKPGLFGTNNFDFASLQVREYLRVKLPNWVFDRFPNWPSFFRWFARVFACNPRTQPSTDSRTGRPPKFGPPTAQDTGLPHVRDPISSPNQDPRTSHIREFVTSLAPGFRKS